MKTFLIILFILIALFTIYALYELYEHKNIEFIEKDVTNYSGMKLCIISDLHNNHVSEKTVKQIADRKPDVIIIAGDLINKSNYDFSHTVSFIYELSKISKIIYCYGNHELKAERFHPTQWENFKASIAGMCDIVDTHISLSDKVELYGLKLSGELYSNKRQSMKVPFSDEEKELFPDRLTPCRYNIVVCHTPAYIDYIKDKLSPDLIISAHLHGGHIRLPFVGGIIYTIHPKPSYCEGLYRDEQTTAYVSRGTGTHFIPIRFNNRCEITFLKI